MDAEVYFVSQEESECVGWWLPWRIDVVRGKMYLLWRLETSVETVTENNGSVEKGNGGSDVVGVCWLWT